MSTTHNFELSEDQSMIVDTVRKLVQDEIEPRALECDEHERFVRESFDQLAEMGILGLPIAEESGGAGMDWLSFVAALEEIAGACGSTARLLLSQTGLCAKALEGLASARDACEALASGQSIGAYVGPECGITAQPDGDGYKLSGHAPLVTAAMEAGLFVVAATDPDGKALLFCLPADGVQREGARALGFRASAPGRVAFADHSAPASTLAASGEGAADGIAKASLGAWLGGGAIAVGTALASYELTKRYASERIAFGKPLSKQQAVAHKLVESYRRAHAARHMVYHAARVADLGQDATESAMMAKITAVGAAGLAADEGIQIHGGYGYVVEYHVERHYRDVETLGVLDRGAEQLRDALAAQLAV